MIVIHFCGKLSESNFVKCLVQAGAQQIVLKNDEFVDLAFPKNFRLAIRNIVSFSELRIGNKFSPRGPAWLGAGLWKGVDSKQNLASPSSQFCQQKIFSAENTWRERVLAKNSRGRSASSLGPG